MGNEDNFAEKKKPHRERHSGRKAEKKVTKNLKTCDEKGRNPKAFTFNSAVKAERRFRRTQDLQTKKQHIPVVDRTPVSAPPVIVAVVGPPKVGKTLLIQCLIKNFSRQPLTNLKGPVTIVSGKKRRLTLIECNNEIHCMIDIAKVADLVLLLVDASFGFEMEIFEFLNICQVHGMPRIIGVLTHLDMLKRNKQLKRVKKTLKHRFWTEVYAGAKLFYLSGLLHGVYLRNEIKNLGRFISVMKFRPLLWRSSHPYVLVDRLEDITPPEMIRQNPVVDRQVCLYGFVRGIPLSKKCSVHIPGCGDFQIQDISFLPDPCPLPEKEKKRSLVDKEKFIYAPFAGVGGIVYDKDAVYIELAGSHSHDQEKRSSDLVTSLLDVEEPMDSKMSQSELRIFTGAEPLTAADLSPRNVFEDSVDENGSKRRKVHFLEEDGEEEREEDLRKIRRLKNYSSSSVESKELQSNPKRRLGELNQQLLRAMGEENEEEVGLDDEGAEGLGAKGPLRLENIPKQNVGVTNKISQCFSTLQKKYGKGAHWSDEEEETAEESESEDDSPVKWKSNLATRAANAFVDRQINTFSLWKLVYGQAEQPSNLPGVQEEGAMREEVGGLFWKLSWQQKQQQEERDMQDGDDCSHFNVSHKRDWSNPEVHNSVRDCFVTGLWKDTEDAQELLRLDDAHLSDNSDVFGDFEDLETRGSKEGEGVKHKQGEKAEEESCEKAYSKAELIDKKKKLKEKFDAEYDKKEGELSYYDELKQEVSRQAELNKSVFEGMDDEQRVQLEGFRPGMYVRVELGHVPCELLTHFDPSYPIIIGGLQTGEENVGYVQVRMKKHRWYERILKNRDPLVVSLGWRRFQTLPIFAKLEDNLRHRMLKYTPEHVACIAHFWGPITPQTTGFLAIRDVGNKQPGFRIAATGAIVELDKSVQVMKKLKLTGVPIKIYKKTAFIRGMFTSALEVAKFEGAKVRTVSGIRGQIKKAVGKPEGALRATFEDKILLSDIVFCRTWYRVDVPRLYNPVSSLLLPPSEKQMWQGMKTAGQVKREQGLRGEPNQDSLYSPIDREASRAFAPLTIPKALQRALPYKDKPKKKASSAKIDLEQKRIAVLREPHEQKVASLIKMVKSSYKEKQKFTKEALLKKKEERHKMLKREEMKLLHRQKEVRKQVFRTLSKFELKKAKTPK